MQNSRSLSRMWGEVLKKAQTNYMEQFTYRCRTNEFALLGFGLGRSASAKKEMDASKLTIEMAKYRAV